MSVQVNIYEAESKFSKLINQAIAGEEIIASYTECALIIKPAKEMVGSTFQL